MTNTELRSELLEQHAALRNLATLVRAAAEQATAGPAAIAELRAVLAKLAAEVESHNDFEERTLHQVLPGIDAWGPQRDERVYLCHAAEHVAIGEALDDALVELDAAALAERILTALARLSEHMEREEREILAGDVLRDDIVTSGVGG
jgi:hypothetical protein